MNRNGFCGLVRYALVCALAFAVGYFPSACKSQILPPTNHTFTIQVTSGPCTATQNASQCGYIFSEAPAVAGVCPSVNSTAWAQLNSSTPVASPTSGSASFTDNAAAGKTVCGLAQTVTAFGTTQQGVSPASNVAGPYVVPANPTAPNVNGTQANNSRPALPLLVPTGSTGPALAKAEVRGFVR